MTENDFAALRAAVRDSIIGTAVTSVTASAIRAASNASAMRIIQAQVAAFQGLSGSAAIKLAGIALTSAGIAAWTLAGFVPLYVATAIPRSAFLALALIGTLAAIGANSIAEQWSRSRMRRVTSWLRGA
jgi:hypothetical protein